jgi:amino acid adenylation domain-containing protein
VRELDEHSGSVNDGTLAAYLSEAASRHGDRPAIRDRHREVSYAELDRMSNSIAQVLASRGPVSGARIAIWLNKSVEALVAIHAVLRVGAAYVPIDPTAPAQRVARVIEDSGAAWIVTTADRVESLEASVAGFTTTRSLLLVDGAGTGKAAQPGAASWEESLTRFSDAASAAATVKADDVAYILYTSGSTGVPKGVTLTHANARAFVDWASREFALTSDDVLASHAPLHFDLSILDVFAAVASAGCVALVPDSWQGLGAGLARFIDEQRISVWYSVPSALQRIVAAGNVGLLAESRLRIVAFAGEEYPVRHLRSLASVLPSSAVLYNLYGPTETNVCTYHRLSPDDLAADAPPTVPIGRICPYDSAVLIDEQGRVLPDPDSGSEASEITGELCVAGDSVMLGYWGDEAKTSKSTFQDAGVRYYRTGDMVRKHVDGVYTFIGRVDGMVKVKGYRIELGEIEAALDGRPEVREAVCVVAGAKSDAPTLVAFVTASDGSQPDEASLRRHCGQLLPRYMVPERIEVVPALRYTSTGKIDRRSMTRIAEESADSA